MEVIAACLLATNVLLLALMMIEKRENQRQTMELLKLIKAQSLSEFQVGNKAKTETRNWLFDKMKSAYKVDKDDVD